MVDEACPWHPVALSSAVPAGVTRAVILDGTEIVLWRGADGEIHAWDDRCPHRGMRLSYGFVRGNALNCLYHGWEYDGSSRCIRIPAHPDLEVPKSIKATAYAVHETGGLIWMNLSAGAAPPEAPVGEPLISVAVEQPIAVVRGLLKMETGSATVLRGPLLLALHPVGQDKCMLHALTIEAVTNRLACAATVRDLRRQAEMLEAA